MRSSTKILIFAAITGLLVCFSIIVALIDPPPNTIVQHPVETIEFVNDAEFNETEVFVKTDRENIIIDNRNIDYIRTESGKQLTLDEVRYGSPLSAFDVRPYNLHIPEDRIEDIRDAYLKTFGKELVFAGDTKTD